MNQMNQTNQATPEIQATPELQTTAPSIASSAMFAELSIGNWTARKLDRGATKQTTSAAGASDDAGAFHKKLIASPTLEAVQKHITHTRANIHYRLTMPWSDLGLRLLPTAVFPEYYRLITEAEREFHRLVEAFLQEYEWAKAQAQARLGLLFSDADYPTVEAVASKFRFRHTQTPIPDVDDFRLNIGHEAEQTLKQQYANFYTTQIDLAMRDVWQQTYDALSKMSERLDYTDKEDKNTRKIFRDSLVENVKDLLGLLPKFNITQDQRLENMRLRLEDAMLGVSADALRDDDTLRLDTKAKVDGILKSFAW